MSWSFLATRRGSGSAGTVFGSDPILSLTAPSSTALNFLAAAVSTNITVYNPAILDLDSVEAPQIAGHGGHAVVQVGWRQGTKVAVKRARVPTATAYDDVGRRSSLADKNFTQMTLELRILTHARIRQHPHVVNCLGICVEPQLQVDSPFACSLVLEYSKLGNLASFLARADYEIDIGTRIDLGVQVGRGLDVLHQLKICHGDVKNQNVLVFATEDGRLVAKVSDFGNSVVGLRNEPDVSIQYPVGTPLLNAPEIRNSSVTTSDLDIDAVIRTDIYSFGLLVWEVIKHGQPFFDEAWIGLELEQRISKEAELAEKESFLGSLPQNTLLQYGLSFLVAANLDPEVYRRLSRTFRACLQDDPWKRKEIPEILQNMCDNNTGFTDTTDQAPVFEAIPSTADRLTSWTMHQSLFQMLGSKHENLDILGKLPSTFQQDILKEIKALAISPAVSKETRAHASMLVAEAFSVALGSTYDDVELLRWLNRAGSEGHPNAVRWYDRVCEAIGPSSETVIRTAPELGVSTGVGDTASYDSSATEMYLANRIRYDNDELVKYARTILAEHGRGKLDSFTETSFFIDYLVFDNLQLLHVAAFVGDDAMTAALLRDNPRCINDTSAKGLNAAHYACMGGHLSTLRLVLDGGVSVLSPGDEAITALHLSIFFADADIPDAVGLLIEKGARTDVTSGRVTFEAYNLVLEAGPLEWAVITRNRALVHALLPYSQGHVGIQEALSHFYYEIASDLLSDNESLAALPPGYPELSLSIKHPFGHWIAHARDSRLAIQRTVQLCTRSGLGDPYQLLKGTIQHPKAKADFQIIEAVLEVSPQSVIRQGYDNEQGILMLSIAKSGDVPAWDRILRLILDNFSVAELDELVLRGGIMNYLHAAISVQAITAIRVLLEKGVNPNAPMGTEPPIVPLVISSMLGSRQMWRVLREHGARVDMTSIHASVAIAHKATMRLFLDDELTSNLSGPIDDVNFAATLQELLKMCLSRLGGCLESFRIALSHERAARCVDRPDKHGMTMLQRAVSLWNAPVVKVLLDAGADVMVPFPKGSSEAVVGGAPVLTVILLQVACTIGSRLPFAVPEDDEEAQARTGDPEAGEHRLITRQRIRTEAMTIAMEFLRWHEANGDHLFEGITELHLAARMELHDEAQRLVESGGDVTAKGVWPGMEGRFTPREFYELDFTEENKAAILLLKYASRTLEKRWYRT